MYSNQDNAIASAMPCKPNYEDRIKRTQLHLETASNLRDALQRFTDVRGTPHGQEGVYFMALYGDMHALIRQLKKEKDELIKSQEEE